MTPDPRDHRIAALKKACLRLAKPRRCSCCKAEAQFCAVCAMGTCGQAVEKMIADANKRELKRIAELQSRLDEAGREILDLRAEVAQRREHANAAMDWLRSRFAVRPDCMWVDEAAQDAVNAHNLVVERLHAAEAAEVRVYADLADAVAAHDVSRGTLASVSAQLDRARARLDQVRLAALVLQGAAERLVENTGSE